MHKQNFLRPIGLASRRSWTRPTKPFFLVALRAQWKSGEIL